MIQLKNVSYCYPNRSMADHHLSDTLPALGPVTFSIPTPGLLALMGPNGSGKSTLLKVLAGMLRASTGNTLMPLELQQRVGYLSQHHQMDLDVPLSIFEVAAMGLWRIKGALAGIGKMERQLIYAALEQVGLADLTQHLASELSGGQLQRLRFARLLLEDARLLLLDEPFNAVDEKTQVELMQLLLARHRAGCTLIVALHDKAFANRYFPLHVTLQDENSNVIRCDSQPALTNKKFPRLHIV